MMANARGEPLLSVEGLAKSFNGFRAVRGVSFDLWPGELVALIGPNGAGKTTTFNMINGQIRPDRGAVRLAGKEITGATPQSLWRLGVARTFQISSVFSSMTVAENVGVALTVAMSADWRLQPAMAGLRARILELLDEVGMAAAVDRPSAGLPYGDIKRLEFAMALAGNPRLILMDEPTAGMAPAERTNLMKLVVRRARERGTTVLFTEHDMDVVFGNASRILVMNRGQLIAAGSPDAIRADPLVQEVYLGTSDASGR